MDDIRYSRQVALPAIRASGQARLRKSSVLIVGAGGLGTAASLYLASSGVGQLLINDFDTIDATNLPRQILYRDADVGQPKAIIATQRLREINPGIKAIAIEERVDRDGLCDLVDAVGVVLDCTDNFASRWLLNEVTFSLNKPLVVGAAIRWEGQLAVFRNDRKMGPCYRCLYSEADENLHDCAGQGIVASVAGTIGTMMATETIKLLLDIKSQLAGNLWLYDANAGSTRQIKIRPRSGCPVCDSL